MAKKREPKGRLASRNKRLIGVDTLVDQETGEVLSKRLQYRERILKTEFVTMYLGEESVYDLIGVLGNKGQVLVYILKDYNDKTGMFYFTNTTKGFMVEKLSLSIGTIRSCVKDLSEGGILLYIGGSEYMVNPHLFYKGSQANYSSMVEGFDNLKRLKGFSDIQKKADKS